MCSTGTPPAGFAAAPPAAAGQAAEQATAPLAIPLEPVDSVTVTTLVDNNTDLLATDTGPARRPGLAGGGTRVDSPLFEGGWTYQGLIAEHGFSALVSVTRNASTQHLLFDAGLSPDALAANMAILGVDPGGVAAIVLSHGHFDHTAGLGGFVRAVGRANVPVIIHPEFWSRRRLVIGGQDPFELPTASRAALEETGFTIVEDTSRASSWTAAC